LDLVFRPLLGWATAWSFDRLRLWIESNLDPAFSLRQSLVYGLSRGAVAFIWIYHGLVPKLLFRHEDELSLLRAAGISEQNLVPLTMAFGVAEIVLGLAMLRAWQSRFLLVLTIVLMILALVSVAIQAPGYLTGAFNPVTLNLAMITLATVALLSARDLPTSRRCKRKKRDDL
jgi:hypothetical protein